MFRIEGYGPRAPQISVSAFLLAFVTTPIDIAHSMYHACKALCFLLCEYYGLVKVVNNVSGTCLAGSYSQTEMQSPIEYKILIST